MIRRTTALIAALVAAVLVLASCTGTDHPAPATTPPPSTTSAPPRPTAVPTVAQPVDLRPYRRHSCALLTTAQLADLGFPPQSFEGANAESGRCEWRRPGRPGEADGDLYGLGVHLSGDPLGEAYRDADIRLDDGTYLWALFEERTVRGLPAVAHAHRNHTQYCDVVVGTGQDQGISVGASVGRDDPELCDRLVTVAEFVVDAIRR